MFSIAHSGMALFDRPIQSTIGGLEIDLASAPISPGEHRLTIEAMVGGIEIYLPKYVQFTIEGGPMLGGVDVHDGLPWSERFSRAVQRLVFMPSRMPAESVPSPDPSTPTRVHFVIDGGIGGVDIYRV